MLSALVLLMLTLLNRSVRSHVAHVITLLLRLLQIGVSFRQNGNRFWMLLTTLYFALCLHSFQKQNLY